jgi:soluble lytic murein transglycosylase-like protein
VRADPRTGRLVRTTITGAPPSKTSINAKPSNTKPSIEISEIVDHAARTHSVDPLLVHSIIKQESNYNAYAISNKGAEGLMQLMPPTARMLGVSNSFDPRENIEAGVKYLKYLQGVFKDDRLALAAYNAGPGNVEKYKQVPPIKETQDYVEQVGRRYENAKRAQQNESAKLTSIARPAIEPPLPERVNLEKHPKLEQFVDEHGRLSLRTIE